MKTNYFYALENILPTKKLRRIILAVTSNCNSRCKTCFLWKKKTQDKLDLNDFKKFANEPAFRQVRFLVLTGGEPFLRGDIVEARHRNQSDGEA